MLEPDTTNKMIKNLIPVNMVRQLTKKKVEKKPSKQGLKKT